ncbi:hypothetical protein [Nocardia mexicana]|uniref:Transmembrane protein n=1 Tax=Nocardia mexicana TaxID=279262 RepID=A0A370H1W7_9NOCA|nr:hypothetical protein [Nocardia mexicana]RDI50009.1 hypothetical protein DFR68_106447 [Nocardia mexicana]
METEAFPPRPSAAQARIALDEAGDIRESVRRLSATPWPVWFTAVLTVYAMAYPVVFGGAMARPEWLVPQGVWVAVLVAMAAVLFALLAFAGRAWTRRTGVALRMDVLPARILWPALGSYLLINVGAVVWFRGTGSPWPLLGASAVSALYTVGSHLLFVRMHEGRA